MPTIMFVCTANQCRSPMAEALFRQWLQRQQVLGEWRVLSSGTWATEGSKVVPSVRKAMLDLGIDLARHRARCITSDLLKTSDLVLCMTQSHREALRVEFPQYAERIRLLSEMAGQKYDVPDMAGFALAECTCMARELIKLIECAGERIMTLVQPMPLNG